MELGISIILNYGDKMLRKIIFIGQTRGDTIYLNTETNQILKRKSNSILKMEGSRYNRHNAAVGVMAVSPLLGLISFILARVISTGNLIYTKSILVCLALIWFVEIVGFIWVLELALYGRKSIPFVQASNSEFGQAYRSNIMFNNPKGGKVTAKNKILTLLFVFLMACCAILMLIFMFLLIGTTFSTSIANFLPEDMMLLNKPFEFKVFFPFMLFGFMPFIGYLMIFQNNPFRWLLAVEKYKLKKLKARK